MLTPKRRHSRKCSYYRDEGEWDSRTNCKCPIIILGTVKGVRVRLAAAKYLPKPLRRNLDAANELAALWQRKGEPFRPESWPPAGGTFGSQWKTVAADPAAVTIERAIETFLRDKTNQNLERGTIRKFESLLKTRRVRAGGDKQKEWSPALMQFCEDRGYVYLVQLGLPEVADFRSVWRCAPNTAQKELERLRAFFRYCQERSWISRNPTLSRTLAVKTFIEQKEPFTPEEYQRIVDACWLYPDDRWGNIGKNAVEMYAMVLVLRWTGLRISDAVMLEKGAIVKGSERNGWSLNVFQKKVRRWVKIALEDDVVDALRALPFKHDRYFFWKGTGKPQTAINNWRQRLDGLFRIAETQTGSKLPFAHHPHPHRFRHTFAAEHLLSGVDIRDVSLLLGHASVAVTERHYAKFNVRAQATLDSVARESNAKQRAREPKLKLVAAGE